MALSRSQLKALPGSQSFSLDISRFAEKAAERAEAIVRKVALDLFSRIVHRTPVDTGRARANWQLAIGSVPSGTLELDDKAGTATVSRAFAAAQGWRPGERILLVNNLPYIIPLEYGHSSQAPSGMARVSVAEFQQAINIAVQGT